ncbi:MAG: hypothetical protein RSF67_05920, partial [Clostridia bacterium]
MDNFWNDFKGSKWRNSIDVDDFIVNNYKEYLGDDSFLEKPTNDILYIWNICEDLLNEEQKKGILDVELKVTSGI